MDDNIFFKFIVPLKRNTVGNWYRYDSGVKQVLRLKRKGAFKFTIWDVDNNILDVGTNGRVTCLLTVTPFHLDWINQKQARIL